MNLICCFNVLYKFLSKFALLLNEEAPLLGDCLTWHALRIWEIFSKHEVVVLWLIYYIFSSLYNVVFILSPIWMVTGTIILITLPALYSKYDEHVDKYCGMLHHRFSKHYKVVDENVPSRLFRSLSKDKDSWVQIVLITHLEVGDGVIVKSSICWLFCFLTLDGL